MSLNSSGGDGASSVLHVPPKDLDYERRLTVLIASTIGGIVMAGIVIYIMWGLFKNRLTIQKIYIKQAKPGMWAKDENEAEQGLSTVAVLPAKKSMNIKDEHSSEETDKMLVEENGGENPAQTVLGLLSEDKSPGDISPLWMSIKTRV